MADPILIDSGPSERGAHYYELFARCPQLWSWYHHSAWGMGEAPLNSQLTVSEALIRGTLVHIGLAHYYARIREMQMGGDPDLYYSPLEAMRVKTVLYAAHDHGGHAVALKVLPICEQLFNAYVVAHQFEKIKVLHVEEQFRGHITNRQGGDPYLYTVRFDLVYEDSEGRIWGCDHKTQYKIDDGSAKRYPLSLQFLGQQWFGHKLWPGKFGGIKLNMLCTRLDSKELFKRLTLPPAPAMLAKFPRHIQDGEERKQLLLNQGRKPDDYPRAASEQVCMTAYGPCAGFDLCSWGVEH